MKQLRGWNGITALAIVWSIANDSAAQAGADDATRAAARRLGEQGIQAYWANDFASADEKLDKAFHLYSTPTLGLWSARARAKRERWVEAAERYREAARASETLGDVAAQKQAQQDATKELLDLTPRIPTLTIEIKGAEPSEVTVTLDASELPAALIDAPRPTNPGKHKISALRGSAKQELEVTLAENEQKTIHFEFQPPAPTPAAVAAASSEAQPAAVRTAPATAPPQAEKSSILVPLGIGAVSLGAAALITSGLTALVANGKRDACPNRACSKASDKAEYDSWRGASTVTFYGGAVLAVAGAVGWIVGVRQNASDRALSLELGPAGAVLTGKL